MDMQTMQYLNFAFGDVLRALGWVGVCLCMAQAAKALVDALACVVEARRQYQWFIREKSKRLGDSQE